MSWKAKEYRAHLARRADATNVPPGKLREAQAVIAVIAAKDSPLEKRFAWAWQAVNGPALVREHRFDEWRKWRFDFAHVETRTAIEVEGGTWTSGRHTSGVGFRNDCEKYNEAQFAGWTVFRLTEDMLRLETIRRIEGFITGRTKQQTSPS